MSTIPDAINLSLSYKHSLGTSKTKSENLNCFLYKINALFVTIFYSLTNFFIRNAKTEAEKKKIDLTI